MDDYTPSTEDVRESYTYFRGTIPTVEHEAEFDRWEDGGVGRGLRRCAPRP